jgi:hypothetical protein
MMNKSTNDKKQSAKFVEAARELGCDTDEAKFNAALGKVARHKVPTKPTGPAEKKVRNSKLRP